MSPNWKVWQRFRPVYDALQELRKKIAQLERAPGQLLAGWLVAYPPTTHTQTHLRDALLQLDRHIIEILRLREDTSERLAQFIIDSPDPTSSPDPLKVGRCRQADPKDIKSTRILNLGLIEGAEWAAKLKPLIHTIYTRLTEKGPATAVSTPKGIMSVAGGPLETEEDVDLLAEKLKEGIRGESWHGHHLKFAGVIMQMDHD